MNALHDEVLQLGICGHDGNEVWNKLYKPKKVKAWPEAAEMNGITPDDVADCGCLEDDKDAIQEIIDSADIVYVYNAAFDTPFLKNAGIDFGEAEVHCTMLDFSELYGEWNEYFKDYTWQKLVVAYALATGGEGYPAHDALADARATVKVQDWCNQARIGLAREHAGRLDLLAKPFR